MMCKTVFVVCKSEYVSANCMGCRTNPSAPASKSILLLETAECVPQDGAPPGHAESEASGHGSGAEGALLRCRAHRLGSMIDGSVGPHAYFGWSRSSESKSCC